MLLAATSWPDVALALVPTIAAVAAALVSYLNHRHLRTPSGTSIGKQVESAHHVSLGNNYYLQALTGQLGVPKPGEVEQEERRIEPPDGSAHKRVIPPGL